MLFWVVLIVVFISALFAAYCIGRMLGYDDGLMADREIYVMDGVSQENRRWQYEMFERGWGEWTVNKKTGHPSFQLKTREELRSELVQETEGAIQ